MAILLAPLTEEEVAAIDAAGAKGPPVTLRSVKKHYVRRVLTVWSLTTFVAIVLVYLWVSFMRFTA